MKFTEAEKRYISLIGEAACIEAYNEHMRGNGGNTVGEGWAYQANEAMKERGASLFDRITPSRYTKFGDCIINAGRKLTNK